MKKVLIATVLTLTAISSAQAVDCQKIARVTAKRFQTGADSREILATFCNVGEKLQIQGVDPHTFAAADAQQAADMVTQAGIDETEEGKNLAAAMADAGRLGYNASAIGQ